MFTSTPDCPQVICKQPYQAQDRDELRLDVYDRVDIDKKIEGKIILSRPFSSSQDASNRLNRKQEEMFSTCVLWCDDIFMKLN